MKTVSFCTSSKYKQQVINDTIKFLGLGVEYGFVEPLRNDEPNTNILDVVAYKATNENGIIEDTYLIVDGEHILNTKYELEKLSKLNKPAKMVCAMGYHDKETDYIHYTVNSTNIQLVGLKEDEELDEKSGFDQFTVFSEKPNKRLCECGVDDIIAYSPRTKCIVEMTTKYKQLPRMKKIESFFGPMQ